MSQDLRARANTLVDRLVKLFSGSETLLMTSGALATGALAGCGTVLFRLTVDGASAAAFGGASAFLPFARLSFLILPALGGLLVGLWMLVAGGRDAGQGVSGIMEAVAFDGGRIGLRGAVARVVGAIITIGSGGSAGPEDPSVQIGATLGSQLGQVFGLAEARIRTLVGCGAAAGIAAAFNAPISGVFFAIEIVLGEFSGIAVSFIVLAAVAGAVVSQSILGSRPAFAVPTYELRSPVELIFYFGLGCLAALVGVAYIKLLDGSEQFFEHLRAPNWIKPALGGLAVGLLAFAWRPEILGTGYGGVQIALQEASGPALVFFGLTLAKLLATPLTIGSGGQGGLFAPSLFLGAMLGVGFGGLLNLQFNALAAPPAAYGMVGMGAVLASAIRAPIVAILLPFEMTNDYRIILPLMLASVTAFAVARLIEPESVYTVKLKRKGIDLLARHDLNLLRAISIGEAMSRDVPTVSPEMPLQALVELFHDSGYHAFPVMDERSNLIGIVTLGDYSRAARAGQVTGTVADILTRDPITAFPDESLEDAVRRLGLNEVARMPVVDRRDHHKLLGVLRQSDIARAYSGALLERAQTQERLQRARVTTEGSPGFVEIEIPAGARSAGKALRELKLPGDSILVSVKRRDRVLVARGNTVLQPGDRVTAFVTAATRAELERALRSEPAATGAPNP